jgi:hypothetical protein
LNIGHPFGEIGVRLLSWLYKSSTALLIASTLGVFSNATAAPITYNFTGTVFHSDGAFASEAGIGSTITGSYSVELTSVDANPGDPTLGEYLNITTSLVFSAGSVSGSSTSNHTVLVANDRTAPSIPGTYDAYVVHGSVQANLSGGGGIFGSDFRLAMTDGDGTIFSGDGLPTSSGFFSPAAFSGPNDAAVIDILTGGPHFSGLATNDLLIPTTSGAIAGISANQLRATIDTFTQASTASEPAVLALFAFGIAGLHFLNRRQRKTSVEDKKSSD